MGTKKENNQNNTSIIILAVLLIAVVVVAIGVLLYNKGAQGGANTPGGKESQGQGEAKKTETQETDFTKWVSDTIDGNYYIPSLIFDTDDAKAINDEITKECANRPEVVSEDSPFGIGYNTYCNKGVLSLVLIISDEKTHYKIYNVDTETGLRLSNKELLEKVGVTEEAALETIKGSAESLFRTQYAANEEDEAYKASLDSTLAEVNGDMLMYLDENTSLVGVVKLHEMNSEVVSENLVVLGLDGIRN